MATLTSTRTLMKRRPTEYADRVLFREDLEGEPGVARGVTLSHADWVDMGSPKVVTVTIDPGDTLNTEDFDCWTDMGDPRPSPSL